MGGSSPAASTCSETSAKELHDMEHGSAGCSIQNMGCMRAGDPATAQGVAGSSYEMATPATYGLVALLARHHSRAKQRKGEKDRPPLPVLAVIM